jgi:hypothetical protein
VAATVSPQDVSLLLALLGGTTLTASWIARRTGDSPQDVRLMLGVASCKLALSLGLYLSA